MFVRRPLTKPFFEPAFHSPSIAYWVMQPGSENNDEKAAITANKKSAKEEAPTPRSWPLSLDSFDIVEEEEQVVLSTDLPGTKHADLKVEFRDGALQVEGSRKRGSKKQSFIRRLAMDEDAVDIENLTATLEDGILTVKAPKAKKAENEKEAEALKVTLSKTSPPEVPVAMNKEIDMPGVKVEDLEIVLAKNGMLSVFGERKNANAKPTRRTEAYMLNGRKLDTSKLEAFLCDGVLTIRAPAKEHKIKMVAVNGELPPTTTVEPKKLDNKVEEEEKEKEE